jgi:hypothetical protein
MAAGDDIARLKAENAELRRLLALYRGVIEAAGIPLPKDSIEVAEFWRAVAAHVAETNGDAFPPGDPD